MTRNFTYIPIDNLEIVQQQVLNVICEDGIDTTKSGWHWVEDHRKYLNIPSLRNVIDSIGIKKHINEINVTVTVNKKVPIHIDYGEFDYGFNIPILNTDNTFLTFYKPKEGTPPHGHVTNRGQMRYWSFNEDEVDIVERIETNIAGIANVRVPHSFENFNDKPRIMLYLRLDRNFSLDK